MRTIDVARASDVKWQAIASRDEGADGSFWYGVKTTGVYCRPACSSRRPNRANVEFFATWAAAERGGYRACKKCRPKESSAKGPVQATIARACEILARADGPPALADLARQVGLSPYHLQRQFKQFVGITPKAFAKTVRTTRFRSELTREPTVTSALYKAGFGSISRGYDRATQQLGMTPAQYQKGGAGQVIRFTITRCVLGWVLVAATERGICLIELGDSPRELEAGLSAHFKRADRRRAGAELQDWVAKVVALIDEPCRGLDLPLGIQGTVFQRKVWEALRAIPIGRTVTYAELARQVGRPSAVRAVASACAANKLAVAIPCHRAVRSDGRPSGYRWGLERKAALQAREKGKSR